MNGLNQSLGPQMLFVEANLQRKYKMAKHAIVVPKISSLQEAFFPILLITEPISPDYMQNAIFKPEIGEGSENVTVPPELPTMLLLTDLIETKHVDSTVENFIFLKELR